MKWFWVFVTSVGLVLGAASARAEPEEFNDPAFYAPDLEVGLVGDPFASGSWTQSFVIKGDLAKIDDPWMYIQAGFDRIKGVKITTNWETPTPEKPTQKAIDNFAAYPDPYNAWPGAYPESWSQTGQATATLFQADGHTDNPDPDNKGQVANGLQFDLNFTGDQVPGIKFELQVLAKKFNKKDELIGYQVRKDFVFWWDGSMWWRREAGSTGAWSRLLQYPAPVPFGVVPEPFSMAFLGSALVGVVGFRMRQRRKVGT